MVFLRTLGGQAPFIPKPQTQSTHCVIMSLIVFEKRSSDITLNTFQMHHAVWKTYRFPFLATAEEECRNGIVHSQLCHTTTDKGCAASTLKHPPDAKGF
jgi:RIO-like serine/threonine protein kinase